LDFRNIQTPATARIWGKPIIQGKMKVGTPKLKLLPGYSTTQTAVGATKSGNPTQWKTNA
jgi:hypothetical protein